MYPKDLYYSKDHEWVKIEGDTATVGITDFAQKHLGDVVYIELPAIGTRLDVHQTIGAVESVKAVSDVYSPISGEVIAVNENLNDSPEIMNQDPHGKGWIIRMKVRDKTDQEKLMNSGDYEKYRIMRPRDPSLQKLEPDKLSPHPFFELPGQDIAAEKLAFFELNDPLEVSLQDRGGFIDIIAVKHQFGFQAKSIPGA